MKNLKFFVLLILLASLTTVAPVQASGLVAGTAQANTQNHMSFDMVCDGTAVCQIQNASLASLNGNIIWLYQPAPEAATNGEFGGRSSLELPDGSRRGFVYSDSTGGYFTIGLKSEGSLARFLAYGTLSVRNAKPANKSIIFHAYGSFIQYK